MNIIQFFERALGQNPDKVFIMQEIKESAGVYRYQNFTYREFHRLTIKLAALMARLEIDYQDRVIIILPNSKELIAFWFAVNMVGGVAVILDTILTAEEKEKAIAKIKPRLIVNEDNLSELLKAAETELTKSPFTNFFQNKPSDVATIIRSSGTTGGRPKYITVTHRAYVMSGEAFPWWLSLCATDENRFYACLPLSHIDAQAYSLMGTIELGATLVIGTKFNKGIDFWKKISASRATVVNMLGRMLKKLADLPDCFEERFHSLVRIANGEAIADFCWHRQLEERFNTRIIISYGSSESPFGGFVTPYDDQMRGFNYVGRPKWHPYLRREYFLLALMKEDKKSFILQTEGVGELVVINPSTTPGYFDDFQLNAEKFPYCHQRGGQAGNDWYFTGDLFYFDAVGRAFFVGRKKKDGDRGKRRIGRCEGNLVAPEEIENILVKHPEVKDVFVVFVDDGFGGDWPKAYLVARTNADGTRTNADITRTNADQTRTNAEITRTDADIRKSVEGILIEELNAFCQKNMPAFKIPKEWVFVDEFPETETGKIITEKLR